MKEWLGRIGGAVGMGLAWAVGWGLLGALIGIVSGFLGIPEESVLDPWIALATPGFVGGVIFPQCSGLQRPAADSASCPCADSPPGGRWLVWCWECFRLFSGQ